VLTETLPGRIAAIVFDMDGVLMDSSVDHCESFGEVLRSQDIHEFNYARFAGWRTSDVFRVVLRENGRSEPEESIARLAETKSRLALERLTAKIPVMPDCAGVLTCLARRYRLGLATSASRSSVELFLKTSGTKHLFRSVLSGEDVQHAKPDPEIYTRTFAALETAARHCIVVEDAVPGVLAGLAAGATVVAISRTCNPEELLHAGAKRIVDSLRALLDVFADA
jgi:beta-phosphoglucomutase